MSALPNPSAPRRGCLTRLGGSPTPRRRLFCLPFAGGGPAAYRLWANELPDDVEVVAVQLPGRNPAWRGPLPASIGEIVEIVLPDIEAATDLPYALFGHSLGGLVAFELAMALERGATAPPTRLFVSGLTAPHLLRTGSAVHALPDEEFLDAISVRFGGVPDAIRAEPDLLALLLPGLRADVRTFETYAPLTDRKVQCPVHVYGGAADAHPRPDQLWGWQGVAESDITVRVFPGGHFYLASARPALIADIAGRWAPAPLEVMRS
jgi:surfactin synthase thioesterase subunit